jgi:hypothetical protein
VTGEVVELEAALKAKVELEVAVEARVKLEATLEARVELDDTRLDAAELNAREDDNSTLVGVGVVELEGAVVGAELDAAVEVVEVVATLARVDKGVVITSVVVVKTTVGEVYDTCVKVA